MYRNFLTKDEPRIFIYEVLILRHKSLILITMLPYRNRTGYHKQGGPGNKQIPSED